MITDKNNGSDEREFLHNIATPLGAAVLLCDSALEDMQNRTDVDPDDLLRLSGISQALEKLSHLLKERRKVLIARGVPSARS